MVAEYYPRRRDPVLGVWAHRQALAARAAGAELRVLALERIVPPAALAGAALRGRPAPLARWLRAAAAQPRRDTLDGIEVEYVRFVSPPRGASYASWHRFAARPLARALGRLHATWRPQLVHAHYALPSAAAAAPWARSHGVPIVVSVHGGDVYGPALAAAPARARVGAVLGGAAAVLCNSRATRARAAALAGGAERMEIVHLGADPPAGGYSKRPAPTVATLAHVIGRKRHEDVLRAVALLRERLPALRWLVIGDGPELPALRALAGELGLAERVEWAGQLPPERALAELGRAHVMAMPSVDEAFGVAYVEALACGLPAIGCRGEGGPEEIAALGGGIVLVPARDPEALAAAIERSLSDPELAAAARRTAAAHFTWERCGRATVAAYARVLAR